MKKSIAYLPKNKQEELRNIVKEINKRLPQAEMIILYGSYARGEQVVYDLRVEYGVPVTKISDYDILVVTDGISDKKAGQILDNIDESLYKYPDTQTPIEFINENIKTLNKAIQEGRYFYTQIKQEGVVLYNSGKYKLDRRRKLNFDEIYRQAQQYFDEKFEKAGFFLDDALSNRKKRRYQMASFYLHQSCENCYYAIRLTYTLQNNKQHNLSKLSSSVKKYYAELIDIFPRNTAEEKRLFNLLKAAYVEARYNPDFVVTQEDIDALIPKVELLRDITKRICEKKIEEYRVGVTVV